MEETQERNESSEIVAEIEAGNKIVPRDEDEETDIEAGIKIEASGEDRVYTVRELLLKRISGFPEFLKRTKILSGISGVLKSTKRLSDFSKRVNRFFQRTNRWTEADFLDYQDWMSNLNSFFVFVSFIGIPLATVATRNLGGRLQCNAGPKMVMKTILLGIGSFVSFGTSMLLAGFSRMKVKATTEAEGRIRILRWGFITGQIFFVCGLVFLAVSIIYLAEIRFGLRSCGTEEAIIVFWGILCTLGPMACLWLIYSVNVFIRH